MTAKVLDVEFFRQCFNEFPDPVIVTDTQGRVRFLNHAAQGLTGLEVMPENLPACADVLRMDADASPSSLIGECLKGEALNGVQVHLRNRSGGWSPYSLSAQLALGKDEIPVGCVAIAREAPSRPNQVDNFLQDPISSSIIKNFPMPFFTVDTNLTITYMNHRLEKITGYRREEVVNKMT